MKIWQLELLGTALLKGPTVETVVERKPAALLAYLALEGPTTRSKLAYLFWPEAREEAARVNLRQLVRRVRLLREHPLVEGEDALRLAGDLEVDAVRLEVRAFSGDRGGVLAASGRLLEHYDYDDCLPFVEWLAAAREHLASLRRQALTAQLDHLEAQGVFAEARGCAERLLELEPASEEAYRRLMRLHHLNGDRPAALETYHRLQRILRVQFGLEPLPETVALAREVAQGAAIPFSPTSLKKPLPLSVLRPPVLVGREETWSRMEEAWDEGKLIFISGEAGVGKTRLMLDFAASKGPYTLVAACPGDSEVPYATHARCIRQFLDAQPELLGDLEPWTVRELARIVPELGDAPPPMTSEEDKLRHLEAHTLFMARCFRGVVANVCDDMQYYDRASFEAGAYAGTASPNSPFRFGALHCISAFRRSELSPDIETLIEQLVTAGVAVQIELGPLSETSISELLAGLDVPGRQALSTQLVRLTGGNPLYILETVRHLIEIGRLDEGLPERMLPPGKVGSIIRRRLERLSPAALRVAQAAAMLQSDFDPMLVGELLELGAVALIEPWEELEKAQVLRANRFAHDLVYETVRQAIPPPVAALLHRRAAEVLAGRRANPLRVAEHWLGAGDDLTAAPYLVQAAEAAQAASLWVEAKGRYRQAAAIYVAHGESEKLALTLLRLHQLPT